jgi:hypothetical protein
MMPNVANVQRGDRVGAMCHRDKDTIYIFGYGTFLGNLVPGEDSKIPLPVGAVAASREPRKPNPCIELDSGKHVWGCECWWGPERAVRDTLEASGMEIVTVDIDDTRQQYRESLS